MKTKTHPFKKGDTINVYNCDSNGHFYFEGSAKIIRPMLGVKDTYHVNFIEGEWQGEGSQIRFVDPQADAQENRFDYLRELNKTNRY